MITGMWGTHVVQAASIETIEDTALNTLNDHQEVDPGDSGELEESSGVREIWPRGGNGAKGTTSSFKASISNMKVELNVDAYSPTTEEPSSQTSEVRDLPREHQIRLPMEDKFHSQLTETDQPNACGPTSLYMVLDYFDLEDSLAEVIERHKFPAAYGGYDPSCIANPVCTSPGALAKVAFEDYRLEVDAHEGWTFEEVYQSLASGRPIIADIVWRLKDEGPGHFVVIFGIDTEQRTIQYHDPYDGANMTASWDDFTAAWDGPVDLGDPLQPEGHSFWGTSIAVE